ncbi:MAG: hypothetical protein FJ336_00610 [Sphingomonadales bacterium]|nr:hypothetical protein [Sphingomonadales bacterium]
MNLQNLFKIVLLGLIVWLTYETIETIAKPLRFDKERDYRYGFVIERLKMIRTAQVAYRENNGEFADTWEKLINFTKSGKMKITKVIGNPDDSVDIRKGIRYETILISVADSLFKNYPIDSLCYVPFADTAKFTLRAGKVKKSNLELNVFEVEDSAPFDTRKVLRVGSMVDANLSGNWE